MKEYFTVFGQKYIIVLPEIEWISIDRQNEVGTYLKREAF